MSEVASFARREAGRVGDRETRGRARGGEARRDETMLRKRDKSFAASNAAVAVKATATVTEEVKVKRERRESESSEEGEEEERLAEARERARGAKAGKATSGVATAATATAAAPETKTVTEAETTLSAEEAEEAADRARATVDVDPADLKKPKSKFGPTSAPVYMRSTTITDYKPDVCKDFAETGWCGFGDSCIYAHIRGKYLNGAQLEKKWEELQKGNKSSTAKPDEMRMTGCFICREPFADQPLVKTKCGHTFCRSCALNRFRTDPTCAACKAQTHGIFNEAKKPA